MFKYKAEKRLLRQQQETMKLREHLTQVAERRKKSVPSRANLRAAEIDEQRRAQGERIMAAWMERTADTPTRNERRQARAQEFDRQHKKAA